MLGTLFETQRRLLDLVKYQNLKYIEDEAHFRVQLSYRHGL